MFISFWRSPYTFVVLVCQPHGKEEIVHLILAQPCTFVVLVCQPHGKEEIVHRILAQPIYIRRSGLSTSHGKELVHPLEDWLV